MIGTIAAVVAMGLLSMWTGFGWGIAAREVDRGRWLTRRHRRYLLICSGITFATWIALIMGVT